MPHGLYIMVASRVREKIIKFKEISNVFLHNRDCRTLK